MTTGFRMAVRRACAADGNAHIRDARSAGRTADDRARTACHPLAMDAALIRFGEIEVDGTRYEHDVVIDAGRISKRRKGPSKARRDEFGHTPLTAAEAIPWGPRGSTLVVGTGEDGMLPIADDVEREARRRGVTIVAIPTREACSLLRGIPTDEVRAVLHATC
jgi:hypothetical protein